MDKFVIRKRDGKHLTAASSSSSSEDLPVKSVDQKLDPAQIVCKLSDLPELNIDKNIFPTEQYLNIDYGKIFGQKLGQTLFKYFESNLVYLTGELTRVRVFGKWHQIPRKQVAYGEDGMSYTFSSTNVPAKPWSTEPVLKALCQLVSHFCGIQFNFVLVNRYANGSDHMGQHKDDEKELDHSAPIVSLSLGAERDFVFRRQNEQKEWIRRAFVLENGSLMLMNPPTNKYWYHALPKRLKVTQPRLNFTFRRLTVK